MVNNWKKYNFMLANDVPDSSIVYLLSQCPCLSILTMSNCIAPSEAVYKAIRTYCPDLHLHFGYGSSRNVMDCLVCFLLTVCKKASRDIDDELVAVAAIVALATITNFYVILSYDIFR
jgi:hypothetical protein